MPCYRTPLSLCPVLLATACGSAALGPRASSCPAGEPASPVHFAFAGNRAVDDATLRAAAAADDAPPGRCVAPLVERDVLMIHAVYYDRGFLDVAVGISSNADPDGTLVTVSLREGAQYRVGSVHVGEPAAPADDPTVIPDALRTLGLRAGEPFRRDRAAEALASIRTLYRDRGYADVQVEPVLAQDRARAVVDVVADVRRGPRVTIERVMLRGAPAEREEELRRAVAIADGELFGETKLEAARQRVAAGASRVDVAVEPGSGADRRVIVFEIAPR
jgi:outer membrane protein insertion porin family